LFFSKVVLRGLLYFKALWRLVLGNGERVAQMPLLIRDLPP